MPETYTAPQLYKKWAEQRREPFLRRAQDAAKLTIPSLITDEDHTTHTDLGDPFQSLGARGVNNLASKLMLALLPPETPFFRLAVDPFAVEQFAEEGSADRDIKTEIEESLVRYQQAVQAEVESRSLRTKIYEGFRHLVVGGNVLLQRTRDGLKVYRLGQYVVRRDTEGNLLKGITHEKVSPKVIRPLLDKELAAGNITEVQLQQMLAGGSDEKDGELDLYTVFTRDPDRAGYMVHWQEIGEHKLPSTKESFKQEDSPWMPLRMTHISGEDYGRGIVEEYMGDLQSYEALSQALVDMAAIASRVLHGVRPASQTNVKDLEGLPNGGYFTGEEGDVWSLKLDKTADMRVVAETRAEIGRELSFAFLLNASVQRQAERVTAQEVRFVAQELEEALGGVYSLLAEEFQLPLVRSIVSQMRREDRLPALPPQVRFAIVGGIEGLGKGIEFNRLVTFLQAAAETLGPQVIAERLNTSEVLGRMAALQQVDTTGLLKDQETLQAERDQARQDQLLQSPVANTAVQAAIQNQQGAPAPDGQ